VPRMSLDPGLAGKPAWTQQASNALPLSTSHIISKPAGAATSLPTSALPSVATAPVPKSATPLVPTARSPTAPNSQEPPSGSLASLTVSTQHEKKEPPMSSPLQSSTSSSSTGKVSASTSSAAQRFGAQKTSKFRFLTFKPYHASQHFESISGLSINVAPECSMIEVGPSLTSISSEPI
jgi:coronin-7